MAKKNPYRTVPVNQVDLEALRTAFADKLCICGVDVAKRNFVVALMDADRQTVITISWTHPTQTRALMKLLVGLGAARLDVVMESSGSYGDPLRHLLDQQKLAVYRVSTKRSHDAAELYDGVPSWHDAKSAALLARLHLDGVSEPWPLPSESTRTLAAAGKHHERYATQIGRVRNQLEAELARHWPELPEILSLETVTLLELLAEFGDAQAVNAQADRARELMRKASRKSLHKETIERVIAAAHDTLGLPTVAGEREGIQELAREGLRLQGLLNVSSAKLETLVDASPALLAMASAVGKTTAARLVAECGDPAQYSSSGAYEKSLGLNLKERSSGMHRGQLSISKRGSGRARRLLFLVAMRLVKDDAVARAWHERKSRRDGDVRIKSLIAIMRKLARALWHLAQTRESFDTTRLFDTRSLKLASA